MNDHILAERLDMQALPGLLLDSMVDVSEAIKAIRLGEFTSCWLAEQLFYQAGVSPGRFRQSELDKDESFFDTPKALAALHCFEAMIESGACQEGLVSYLWKSMGVRNQAWLSALLEKLSWNAALILLLTRPNGTVFHRNHSTSSDSLLCRLEAIPDEVIISFAQENGCYSQLYHLTHNKSLLQAAGSADRDSVMLTDLGL